MSDSNLDVVRRGYEAFGRGDLTGLLADSMPQVHGSRPDQRSCHEAAPYGCARPSPSSSKCERRVRHPAVRSARVHRAGQSRDRPRQRDDPCACDRQSAGARLGARLHRAKWQGLRVSGLLRYRRGGRRAEGDVGRGVMSHDISRRRLLHTLPRKRRSGADSDLRAFGLRRTRRAHRRSLPQIAFRACAGVFSSPRKRHPSAAAKRCRR